MSIDFQSVFHQIRALGLQAPAQKQIHDQRLEKARRLLAEYANELQSLREKVERVWCTARMLLYVARFLSNKL